MDFRSHLTKRERRELRESKRKREEQRRCCSSPWYRTTQNSWESRYKDESHPFYYRTRELGPDKYLDLCTFAHPDCIDLDAKIAALKVSNSIVSIISYSGEEEIFWASGTVIGCNYDELKAAHVCTILTSTSALRNHCRINNVADNLKLQVNAIGGKRYWGNLVVFDFHYNIAIVNVESDCPLPAAKLRALDFSIPIDPHKVFDDSMTATSLSFPKRKPFILGQHSDLFKLLPGDILIAIGRYVVEPHELLATCGQLSLVNCNSDCQELFSMNCKISRCGVGGPVINYHGDVIGIAFYPKRYTPFLPINIVIKWWEHVKNGREFCPPLHGMTVTTLGATAVDFLLHFNEKFSIVYEGVIVEEVIPGSPAASAGLCPNDVIVQCDKKSVRNLLEFYEIMLEKAGKSVECAVLRAADGTEYRFTILVAKTKPDKFNCWPIHDLRMTKISGSGSKVTTLLSEW